MAYGITNKSQIIDIDQIERGCNKLQDAATNLKKYGNSVANISQICNVNALSANGKSMVPVIQEYGEAIMERGEELSSYASSLMDAARSVYRTQQNEYISYLEDQKKENN